MIHRNCPDLLERMKGDVNQDIRQQRDTKQNEHKEHNRKLLSEVVKLKVILAKVLSENAPINT